MASGGGYRKSLSYTMISSKCSWLNYISSTGKFTYFQSKILICQLKAFLKPIKKTDINKMPKKFSVSWGIYNLSSAYIVYMCKVLRNCIINKWRKREREKIESIIFISGGLHIGHPLVCSSHYRTDHAP